MLVIRGAHIRGGLYSGFYGIYFYGILKTKTMQLVQPLFLSNFSTSQAIQPPTLCFTALIGLKQ